MSTDFSEVNDRSKALLSTVEQQCREIYDKQCRRIYSLALWMTNNKMAAQRLASRTFLRAFTLPGRANTKRIDRAFLAELRRVTPLKAPRLDMTVTPGHKPMLGNMEQVDLEKAVVQLPAAERLIFLLHDVDGYDRRRISRLLRFNTDQVLVGLHRARLRIRELVPQMQGDKVSLRISA